MHVENFKRWQWACAGLVLGLIFSGWRGWVGPEGALIDRPTLESIEFEKLLVMKSPSGKPAVKDIRVFQLGEGTGWLTAQQLVPRRDGEDYIAVKIPVKTPYIPTINPPAKVDPKYTVVDYLKSMKAKRPEVQFSTRWWAREPARTPIFALVGMLVLGGLWPSLMQILVGAGAGQNNEEKEKKPEYDLSRFGKGKPESHEPVRRGPSEQDLARLRELEAELERQLAPKGDNSLADVSAAPQPPAGSAGPAKAEQPITKLTGGPLEAQADDKPKQQKRYGGEFYPTETHVKRDEKS